MSAGEHEMEARGLSFCIITDGRRPRKLRREIASIRALGAGDCQILVGGAVPAEIEGVESVPLEAEARSGRLGALRNALVARARHPLLVVCDDDLVFHAGFDRALLRAAAHHPVLAVRVLNPDGTRYWDWCSHGGPHGHRLLPYAARASHVYASGAICALRDEVARRVRWDESLGFYEEEDVDFSRRLARAGFAPALCEEAVVTHDDARYRQRGARVRRMGRVARTGHALRTALRHPVDEARRLTDRRARPRPLPPAPAEAARLVRGTGDDWRGVRLLVGAPAGGAALSALATALSGLTAMPLAVPFATSPPGSDGGAIARYRRPGERAIEPVLGAAVEALRGSAHVRWPGWIDRGRARFGDRRGAWLDGSPFALSSAALAAAIGARTVLLVADASAAPPQAEAPWGDRHPIAWLLAQPALCEDHLGPLRPRLRALASRPPARCAGAAWAAIRHVLLRQAAAFGWLVVRERDLRRRPREQCRRILAFAGLRPRQRGWRLADRLCAGDPAGSAAPARPRGTGEDAVGQGSSASQEASSNQVARMASSRPMPSSSVR